MLPSNCLMKVNNCKWQGYFEYWSESYTISCYLQLSQAVYLFKQNLTIFLFLVNLVYARYIFVYVKLLLNDWILLFIF